MPPRISRRDALLAGIAGSFAGRAAAEKPVEPGRKFLTPATKFEDVSRGNPVPHSLTGQALLDAKLTPETWQLEIVAEDKAKIAKPLTLSFAELTALGKTKGVRYLKAMQCNNIPQPLGQGLWEGVLLRDLLELCGPVEEARRLFYWGFHNNDPKQIFRSSLAINQVLDAAPGDLPPFLAYKLNGEPIPLVRGGPVRMVVPWAHGFKSVKWLQKIVLTNKYDANDTYALAGNDPESYLKTAAYFDSTKAEKFPAGKAIKINGTAMVGLPGLERVEYWLRADTGAKLTATDPAWKTAEWKPATIAPPPKDWSA
ncbi:MAG: molybdopterin-dependent oxidoreductase [Gemmataceae bacterium]|nr:molybdopterin-dependent oxidoreductase [Gemmataceae bacterium]